MTERALPSMDGAPACPFVAFGDDRDGRSTSPDHRHRCFAESPPAPRAVAHQEAYCLSSAFPVCPTFQDWARREAAHARGAGDRAETAPSATPAAMIGSDPDQATAPEPADRDPEVPPVRRNPPRDWAAPPPWAAGTVGGTTRGFGGAGDRARSDYLADRPVEGQGLAGSAADRLAGGRSPVPPSGAPAASPVSAAPDDELAGLVQSRPSAQPVVQPVARSGVDSDPGPTRPGRRPTVSSTRPTGDEIPGPAWERMRRYEAYPTIRTRTGLAGVPRVALLAGAVAIAALALFMLPALLGIGGGGGAASPSPSGSRPAVTDSSASTPLPAASQQVYVLKEKDTLSKVANRFGITLEALLAANPEIKNADKVALGQQIIIPVPSDASPNPSVSTPP